MDTPGASVVRSQGVSLRTNQASTDVNPIYTISQPIVVQQKNRESKFATQKEHYLSPEYHSYLFDFPAEIEKPSQKMAQEEIAQKMKSLEQQIKSIQGLASQSCVAFMDLCMFPNVCLLPGFKTPKFEKYDGHSDPIAHLKMYCNQLRGAGGNEELQVAYFGEGLTGLPLNGLLIKTPLAGMSGMTWPMPLSENSNTTSASPQTAVPFQT